jgi:very-short-patch-repair endonuclease
MSKQYIKTSENTGKRAYKVKISKLTAIRRAKKAWETKRKNGTDIPWNKNKKGLQEAWNKGLTKESDPRVKKYSRSLKRKIRKQFRNGRKQYTHTLEINTKMGRSKLGDKNPMRMYPELKEISRRNILRVYKRLNKSPTDIERILYSVLDEKKYKYEKHRIVASLTIPDAYIPNLRTAIYADGPSHKLEKRKKIDANQNLILPSKGHHVLRYGYEEMKSVDFPPRLIKDLEQIKSIESIKSRERRNKKEINKSLEDTE